MGGKVWRTPLFRNDDDQSSDRSANDGGERRHTQPRTSAPVVAGQAGAWGNAGGRRWATRSDDAQLLRAMVTGTSSPPLRRSGRRWAAPADYTEPEERQRSA